MKCLGLARQVALVCAPKGARKLSPGFTLGIGFTVRRALKGLEFRVARRMKSSTRRGDAQSQRDPHEKRCVLGYVLCGQLFPTPLQGGVSNRKITQGKPWAKPSCPFGAQ